MSKKKDLEPFEQTTEDVIANTLIELTKGITGITTSSRREVILSISHIFQKIRGGQFLSTFLDEWKKYREKGKVKDDYQFSEQSKVCLQELLEFLDKDSPDEIRFSVLKKIFLVAATEEITDRESFIPQQFMKISRSLSDGEVVLLSAIWSICMSNTEAFDKNYGADEWIREVIKASGLKHVSLVEIYEEGLMEKRLITRRRHGDGSGVYANPHFRLTDLGYEFCQYIENYDDAT